MKTIYYAGEPGTGYGWGVCNTELSKRLAKRCDLTYVRGGTHPGTVFMPCIDADLNPANSATGDKMLGYTFNEFPLGAKAKENARRYDTLFCGSTWCQERLAERDILNTEVLVQGVDHTIFHPGAPRAPDGMLRIFSGGKFEFRKGQDIVLAAFKQLARDVRCHLFASWWNFWPHTMASMTASRVATFRGLTGHDWQRDYYETINRFLTDNDVDPSTVTVLPPLSQHTLAEVMRGTDIGLFPNRCEGGTNLVLMEYMACGRLTVATEGTGHLDVIAGVSIGLDGATDKLGWVEATPERLAEAAQYLHEHADTSCPLAAKCMQKWTWDRMADQVYALA